jgi:mercuric resistance transcriptional repressor protein MerD
MSTYTVSQLAHDAGVSVHVVRGLVRPVACTTGGYGLFDAATLQRLCFVRAAFEAGIGLDALAHLCRALDAADGAADGAASRCAACRAASDRRTPARGASRPGCSTGHHANRAGKARGESAMNGLENLPPEPRRPVTGYLWGVLAVLTCPCHLPILAAVLAGTTAGAFFGEHWGVAALALTALLAILAQRAKKVKLAFE